MTLLLGAWTMGLILALLALGVFITFRLFRFPDITVDGSMTLGASVAALFLSMQVNPWWATAAGFGAGVVAGAITGLLHAKFKINSLLAGILVMTALYSINLRIMGRSNIPLLSEETLVSWADTWGSNLGFGQKIDVLGWEVFTRDLIFLIMVGGIVMGVGLLLYWFFRTHLGTALRATGDNPQMTRAMGSNVESNRILGVALSNGLVGISGALLAQYQGFSDVQMGIGMIVWGLASVIIGEALTGKCHLGVALAGVIIGSVFFRLVVAMALRWGFQPTDLKLITACFVLLTLTFPLGMQMVRRSFYPKKKETE